MLDRVKWAIGQVLNLNLSLLSLKTRIVTAAVSCGIWALATFIFGKVVMV